MPKEKADLLQGTLDMLILKALERDSVHGFGISTRLRRMSQEVFRVEMGSLYPALCRLEAQGWIRGSWGISDNNRKARYYSLTAAGRKQLHEETARWELLSSTIRLILGNS
ncbi:MAG TPA: PadR family transcriptional regulator [Dongiaceae bacterium]|nr:PadR family transcriptional regulator [Dongiaceae bacterium]HYW82345.1 PadR family transcriptional regulator [Spirochaetia bacterium]